MAWLDHADRCTRVVRDHIGISATFYPVSAGVPGAAEPITAPFDDPYLELLLAGALPPEATEESVLDVRVADLSRWPHRKDLIELTRAGESSSTLFEVTRVRRGGQGTAKLTLTKQTP